MLGVIFGVGAFITTVSLGDGARLWCRQQIATMGENVILVYAGITARGASVYGFGNMPTLTSEDLEAIRRGNSRRANVSPGGPHAPGKSSPAGKTPTPASTAFPRSISPSCSWTLKDGTFLPKATLRRAAKVAVIAKRWRMNYSTGGMAWARLWRIGNVPFIIVGIV